MFLQKSKWEVAPGGGVINWVPALTLRPEGMLSSQFAWYFYFYFYFFSPLESAAGMSVWHGISREIINQGRAYSRET